MKRSMKMLKKQAANRRFESARARAARLPRNYLARLVAACGEKQVEQEAAKVGGQRIWIAKLVDHQRDRHIFAFNFCAFLRAYKISAASLRTCIVERVKQLEEHALSAICRQRSLRDAECLAVDALNGLLGYVDENRQENGAVELLERRLVRLALRLFVVAGGGHRVDRLNDVMGIFGHVSVAVDVRAQKLAHLRAEALEEQLQLRLRSCRH